MPEITCVIITYNEAENIERCLNSVLPISDEIIIVDSFSTDSTPEICKANPKVKFYQRTFTSHGDQKNYGISLAENDYILSLDADEVLSPELLNHMCLNKDKFTKMAYRFRRLNHIDNEPINYGLWYPDEKIRLFRRDIAKWEVDVLHEKIVLEPNISVVSLPLHILHYAYKSVSDFKTRSKNYAKWWAENMYKRGRTSNIFGPLLHATWTFIRSFIIKRAFLDGTTGILIAVQNTKETYLKYKLLRLKQYND